MFNSETAKKAKAKARGRTENKTNRLVKDVFSEVFNELQKNPEDSLEAWAKKNKRDFYALVTKLIPVQLDHAGEVVHKLIIEDMSGCTPLIIENESYTSLQSEPGRLQLPQIPGDS